MHDRRAGTTGRGSRTHLLGCAGCRAGGHAGGCGESGRPGARDLGRRRGGARPPAGGANRRGKAPRDPARGPDEAEPPQDPTPADVPAGEPAPDPAEEPQESLAPEDLRGGLEALLFVMDDPVDEDTLATALRCPVDQVRGGLDQLAESYDRRRGGLTLRRVGEGWRLYTREKHPPFVQLSLLDGQRSRLTQAALETLAVIAYRQPV